MSSINYKHISMFNWKINKFNNKLTALNGALLLNTTTGNPSGHTEPPRTWPPSGCHFFDR